MAFHLNNKLCWALAGVAAAIASMLAMWPVAKDVEGQPFALLLGLLPVYLLLSNYWGVRLISWIDFKGMKFGKAAGVLLPLLLLFAISWAVFGRYFYLSAAYGMQSVDQMTIHFVLRKALQVQQVIIVLLSLWGIRKGGTADLVASLSIASVVVVLVLG